jgi:hypothetical protein
MPTLATRHTRKTLGEVSTVQELLHDFADHGAKEPVPLLISLIIAGFKFVKVLGEALIEAARLRIARLIDPFDHALPPTESSMFKRHSNRICAASPPQNPERRQAAVVRWGAHPQVLDRGNLTVRPRGYAS